MGFILNCKSWITVQGGRSLLVASLKIAEKSDSKLSKIDLIEIFLEFFGIIFL